MADSNTFADANPAAVTPSQRLAMAHAASAVDDTLSDDSVRSEDGIPADIPPIGSSRPGQGASTNQSRDVNFNDEKAFPSLGGGNGTTKPKSLWGNARPLPTSTSTASQVITAADLVTETVKLEADQQQVRSIGKNNAGEVIKSVQKSTGTTIQMSTTQKTGTMIFLIKGKPEAVATARRALMKDLGKRVCVLKVSSLMILIR